MKIIFTLLVLTGISVAIVGYDGNLIKQAYAETDQHNHENHGQKDRHDHENKEKSHKDDDKTHDNHESHSEKDGHDHEDEHKGHKHDDEAHDKHENNDHSSHKDDHEVENNISINSGEEKYADLATIQVSSERLIQSAMLINVKEMSNIIGE